MKRLINWIAKFFVSINIAPTEAAFLAWLSVIVAGIVAFLIAAFLIVGQISSCDNSGVIKKETKINANISRGQINARVDETIANVQENKVKESNIDATNKAIIANAVRANLNSQLRANSGSFSNDAADAIRNFCRDAENSGDALCRP